MGLEGHLEAQLVGILLVIRLVFAGQHLHKGGFTHTVLTNENDDFRIRETTGFDFELEVTQSLGHGGIAEVSGLRGDHVIGGFSLLEFQGFRTRSDIFGGDVTIQEDVDTLNHNSLAQGRRSR